ncbi:MAG TPA: hypothetical protein VKY19_17990 [Ktedonosporobacter sp.]|nr:hypothetical protein [Ktedonosporobacter sp.]
MASQPEDRREQDKQADNKNAEAQRNEKERQRKSTNEEKFTWQPGDVKVYDSIDQIPGFQPFPVKEKKKADKTETEKKEGQQT